MVSSEEVRESVKAYLNLEHTSARVTNKVIDISMGAAAIKVAGLDYFRDLLQTIYLDYNDVGEFLIERRIVPHQSFSDGDVGKNNWRRMIPIDFNHYSIQSSSLENYAFSPYYLAYSSLAGRRYTVLPSPKSGNTLMKVLDPLPKQPTDCTKRRKIKLLYYPIIPAIEEFPEEFVHVVILETLISMAPHMKLQSGQSYIESLKQESRYEKFKLKNHASRVETGFNQQQHNDITQAFLNGYTSDLFLFGRNP